MELNQRVDELEAELKVVKNEVQMVLLDIRERVLSHYDNPFQVLDVSPPSRKEAGDVTTVTAGGGSDREHVTEGATKMEDGAETSQLKSLADQMERERRAAEESARMMPPPTFPMETAPLEPIDQPMPGFPSMQPGQMPSGMPGFASGLGQTPSGMPGVLQISQGMPGEAMGQHDGERAPGDTPGFSSAPSMGGFQTSPGMQPGQGVRPGGLEWDRPGGVSGGAKVGPSSRQTPGQSKKTSAAKAAMEKEGGSREEDRRSARRAGAGEVRSPEGGRVERHAKGMTSAADGTQMNLMTLVGLVRWVEKGIKKIGRERVEAIVEIYRTAGYLPSVYNDTIPQIIRLAEGDKPEGPVTMGVSISVLLELDSLLGGKFKNESAVLATLFGEDGGYPWTKQ